MEDNYKSASDYFEVQSDRVIVLVHNFFDCTPLVKGKILSGPPKSLIVIFEEGGWVKKKKKRKEP